MKAVIIEDEPIASRRLCNLIEEIAPEIKVIGQLTSVANGTEWFAHNEMPDLIFLDIQLNDGYGFDILDTIKDHPSIIFTTAYNEYAIKGFKYNSIDYLLKPIDRGDLVKALNKFRKSHVPYNTIIDDGKINQIKDLFQKEYKRRFMVKVGNQYNSINISDIAYFKSEDGIICAITKNNHSYPIEYSLDQLEDILNPLDFFRVNRKFVIGVDAVQQINTYFNSRLILKLHPSCEDQVIVSRERTTNFKKWLDM